MNEVKLEIENVEQLKESRGRRFLKFLKINWLEIVTITAGVVFVGYIVSVLKTPDMSPEEWEKFLQEGGFYDHKKYLDK